MPVVDFAKMTRTAVGPQWRQATASQRQQLQDGFRSLLTRVYSGAFSSVKDYKAELVPEPRRRFLHADHSDPHGLEIR